MGKQFLPRCGALLLSIGMVAQSTGAADLPLAAAAASPRFAAQAMPPAGAAALMTTRRSVLAPKARSWFDDAAVVLDWLTEPAPAPLPAAMRTLPRPPAQPSALAQTVAAPEDRMLVTRTRYVPLAAPRSNGDLKWISERGFHYRVIRRVEERWITGSGLRFRLIYLDAVGDTIGQEDGFVVQSVEGRGKFVRARVPPALRGRAPIFNRGSTVRFRVEVEAFEDISDLRLSFRQEELDGSPISAFSQLGALTLKAGETGVLEGSTRLSGRRSGLPVNFEHTHVLANVPGEDAARADVPDAGLVDPPGE